jgi:hypothetical protein
MNQGDSSLMYYFLSSCCDIEALSSPSHAIARTAVDPLGEAEAESCRQRRHSQGSDK